MQGRIVLRYKMNLKRKNKYILILVLILLSNILFGCKTKTIEEKYSIQINNGAIAIRNNENYKIYNLNNGKYENIETDYIIIAYDSRSNNFIFNKDGDYKIQYFGEEIVIDDINNIFSPKISLGGEYLSYFVKDVYLNLKIKDLKKDTLINFDSKVSISGELMDWYDEKSFVYYGIDDNKNNGIFLYNIESNEEKLIYKLDSGYVEYLKVLDNGVVFIQEKEGKQKTLKIINENGELKEEINNIVDISDVEHTEDGIFIIGKVENNNYSIYQYSEGKLKRLVYDFPKIINLEKGLSKDSNGNILFIGGEEPSIERVYISEDGAISQLSDLEGEYYFINFH